MNEWSLEKPTREGNWLWIVFHFCECCVRTSGIASFNERGVTYAADAIIEMKRGSKVWWLKIDLPKNNVS